MTTILALHVARANTIGAYWKHGHTMWAMIVGDLLAKSARTQRPQTATLIGDAAKVIRKRYL